MVKGQYGGTVEVAAVELQDRSNISKALGLVIEVKGSGELSQTNRFFIDHDEIESLLKGIDYISRVTAPTVPLKHFEAHYRTKGDFAIITFNQTDGTIGVSVSGGPLSSNNIFISTQDLNTLRNHVVAGKKILDTLDK